MYAPAGLKLGLLGKVLLLVVLIKLPFKMLKKKLFKRKLSEKRR